MNDSLEIAMLTRLGHKFGPVQSHGGVLTRFDGSELPQEDVAEAMVAAKRDLRWRALKEEAGHRIMMVVKNFETEVNILSMLASHGTKHADAKQAKQLFDWIADVRATAHRMKDGDQLFKDDKHWPKPPDGIKELIDKY